MSASSASINATSPHLCPFNISLRNVRAKLTPLEIQNFQLTSLDDLHNAIDDIQKQQVKSGKLQCLIRIQPFLVAMEQYGRVVEVFLNCNDILAFVWGPIKFILQTVSAFGNALEEILATYQSLGESLPQFIKYKILFHTHPRLQKALVYIYEDILDFHRRVLRILKHKSWITFFKCAWQGVTQQIRTVRDNIVCHKELLQSEANLAHFEEAQIARQHAIDARLKAEKSEQLRLMIDIDAWLTPAGSKAHHEVYLRVQYEYPGTGKWLLKASQVKKWLNPLCSDIQTVWLYGIAGAGKTILASILVEYILERRKKASSASPIPTNFGYIAFFYCRHGNQERNNFLVVMRSLISQLIQQNPEIASLVYEKISCTGGTMLVSCKDAVEFLEFVLTENSATNVTYLVIDGLDECDTEEMTMIVTTLTTLAESLNTSSPGVCRLFFTSRNELSIRKFFTNATRLSIKPKDNQKDIQAYTHLWSMKIQQKFELSDNKRQEMEDNVILRANGMFLFCTLVLRNLYGQSRKIDFDREMEPHIFPSGLEDVYSRIIQRLHNSFTPSQKQAAFQILGLLSFAKRPLKKYEIQGFCSMDETGNIDYQNNSLRDDIQDLCGSLVDVYPGDVIEFIHTSVKVYLTQKSKLSIWSEKEIAALCLAHLNTSCYNPSLTELEVINFTSQGFYSTLNYLAIYWIDHVRACVSGFSTKEVKPIIPILESFLETHGKASSEDCSSSMVPTVSTNIRKFHDAFQALESSPKLFQKLVSLSAVALIQEDHGTTGPACRILACTKLATIIERVRCALEHLLMTSNESTKAKLETYYGGRCFKCPEEDCAYFSEGFCTPKARDEHQQKHSRRFFCSKPGCYMNTIRCTSATALKAHIEKDHPSTTSELLAHSGRREVRYPKMKMRARGRNFRSSSGSHPLEEPAQPSWIQINDLSKIESLVRNKKLATDQVRRGNDWFAISNPDVPRAIDIEHIHTLIPTGINSQIWVVKFSHDGRYIALGYEGDGSTVSVFDVNTATLVTSINHTGRGAGDYEVRVTFALSFSPDGKYLATGGVGGLLKAGLVQLVWDILSGSCEGVFEGHASSKYIHAVDFATKPNGMCVIATASCDGTARVWAFDEGRTSECLAILTQPSIHRSTTVTFSPDASLIAVGSEEIGQDGGRAEFNIHIWNISKSCILAIISTASRDFDFTSDWAATEFPNMNEVYTAGPDGKVKRWLLLKSAKREGSVTSAMCIRNFTKHQGIDSGLVLTPLREFLLSVSNDSGINVYDIETGIMVLRLCRPHSDFGNHKGSLNGPNGYLFATAGNESPACAKVWRLKQDLPQLSS